MSNPFRHLPAMNDLLAELGEASQTHSHAHRVEACRAVLDAERERLGRGESPRMFRELVAHILERLRPETLTRLRSVINATGIVLHTNLGRSPLHEAAAQAAYEAGRGYLNLELDLVSGQRGSRQDCVRGSLCALTGAESATVVNNCAAATVIVLCALAAGKEVIVSRGQLIEIGGSFRIPEIMAVSGATLREVGTTNITRLADYERAIGPNTAALMRVHTSNFRVRGFTQAVELPELAALGRKHNLSVIDDAGSGQAIDLTPFGLPGEPLITAGIAAGADVVLFSGDKLLGGPQAGIIAGKAALIERIERDPLMRAFRLDKMTLAALEATLSLYRDPARALREIPTLRMLTMPQDELRQRTLGFAEKLKVFDGLDRVEVREDLAYVGGGSLPEVAVPTVVLALQSKVFGESEFAARLRMGAPPVVARVQKGNVLLDLRTVFEREEEMLVQSIRAATDVATGERPT